jgi:hypothetical protein
LGETGKNGKDDLWFEGKLKLTLPSSGGRMVSGYERLEVGFVPPFLKEKGI